MVLMDERQLKHASLLEQASEFHTRAQLLQEEIRLRRGTTAVDLEQLRHARAELRAVQEVLRQIVEEALRLEG